MNFEEGRYPDPVLALTEAARREIEQRTERNFEGTGPTLPRSAPKMECTFGKNDFGSHLITIQGGVQEVIVTNGYGEQLSVTIDGEGEAGMNAIVFAHPGMGAEYNNLEVNYSPTWATALEEGIDTIIANAEISVDNDIIPYAARTIGRMTTSDALEVLGADNSF